MTTLVFWNSTPTDVGNGLLGGCSQVLELPSQRGWTGSFLVVLPLASVDSFIPADYEEPIAFKKRVLIMCCTVCVCLP